MYIAIIIYDIAYTYITYTFCMPDKAVMGKTVFHGVLDHPKKDQAAINSECLITFTTLYMTYKHRIHIHADLQQRDY